MHLTFKFDGDRRFIIDAAKVCEVIAADGIVPLPRMRSEVLGIVCYRDMLIPVYDFRLLLPDLFPVRAPLPHLILFYGNETLNAFLAEGLESISDDCPVVDCEPASRLLQPRQIVHQDARYDQFDFPGIEAVLNIP